LELGGSCNVIIRRELGVECLGSTPTRFRHDLSGIAKKTRPQEAALSKDLAAIKAPPLAVFGDAMSAGRQNIHEY